MRTAPSERHPLLKRFPRTNAQGRVIHLVIDLMDILREAEGYAFQGPDREPPGIDLAGKAPGRFAGLGVAAQLVEQLRRRRAKKTLDHGPEMWLLWRTIQFRHQTAGQQRLKVHTAKFGTTIHEQFQGES